MEPLKQWICDKCGQLIEKADEGYIEWLKDENLKSSDYKIIHYNTTLDNPNGCFYFNNRSGQNTMPLEEFVNENQMANLLRFLDCGQLHQKEYKGPEPKNLREFVEFMRRLTLPYYEEARLYWDEAIENEYLTTESSEVLIYLPITSRDLIEKYKEG